MGLWEFLRQWQGSRHATGLTLSVVVHALLVGALLTNNPFFAMSTAGTKRGDALIVDLRSESAPAAPGNPLPPSAPPRSQAPRARPAAAPPAPSAKAAPAAAKPAPAATKPAPVATKPTAPEKPAPPPQAPPPRVASVPPSPPAPPVPEPPAPEVTDATRTLPVPATAAPSRPAETPAPSRPAETAAPSAPPSSQPPSDRPVSPSAPAPGTEQQVASVPPGVNAPSGQAYVPDVRSLRPGAGGAYGSSGAGRGGIEGDPVALDTSDPRYGDYLRRVKLAIERNMIYPCVKDPHGRCEYKPAQLLIEFGIRKDGNLAFIEVRQPAAYQVFDDVSANAVKLAAFPPMPEALRRIHPTGLPIVARFRYETTLSLNSIIR